MAHCTICKGSSDFTITKTRDEVEELGIDEITETISKDETVQSTSFSICEDCYKKHLE
jgi:hypothetical protein